MSPPVPHSRPALGPQERRAVEQALASSMLLGGARRPAFRDALAALGPTGTVAGLFSSGRAAIAAGLRALSLPPGAGVVVQTYVCDAVLWAIERAGGRPILCDVAPGAWVCAPAQVEAALEAGVAALVLAPPFGLLQSAAPFRRFGLPILHDLCQAAPSALAGRSRNELGDVVALSFHPTKYLCAISGGAALALASGIGPALARIEAEEDQIAPFSEIQAAVGLAQLARAPDFASAREAIARRYLAAAPATATRRLQAAADVGLGHLFRLPLDVEGRDVAAALEAFAALGVAARRGVDQLAHRPLGLDDARFPNAAEAFARTLSPPFHPSLDDAELDRAITAMERVLC